MQMPFLMPIREGREGDANYSAATHAAGSALTPADAACDIACEAVRAVGLAACSGPWYPLCAAGVEAAYQFCKSRC
jgi:hypothetical protein